MTGHTDWLDAGFHLAIIVTILFAAKLVFEFRHRFDWKGGKIGYAAFFAVLVAIGLIHAFNLLAPHLLPLYGATPENAQLNPELWPDSHRHLTLFTIALIALGLTVTARGIRTLLAMAEASEQKFRDFFDNAPISMTLKDRKGRFVLINKTHEKWFGRPANEVIGKTMLEITGDSTFAGSLRKSEKFVLETNQALETSVRWNKADGQFFDWSLTKFPIRSPDGSIVSIGTFGIDVTERTQAERELAEKTAQLQSILDAAPIYISLRDAQGRYVFVNKLVSDHMGGQPENYIGKTLTELYGDTPTENLDAIAMKVLETRQPVLEREINPPGGSNTILRYSYLPVFHDNGEISGVLSIGQDVTEQLQAQAGKQASEARLSGIVDIASDAIIMVDKDHCVATFNKGAEQIFGYAAAELIGRPLDMLIPEAFRAAHGDQITTFERSSRISRPMAARGEIAGLRKDGSTFPAEASISKLQLGEETVFAVFLCDITDRKRQEKAIRDSEKSLRAILEYSPIGVAIVSHDWVDGHVEAKRLFANDALVEMFGGSSARQMVDDDIVATWIDPDQFHAVNENMKNHVDLVDFQVRRRRIDGAELWVSMNTRPVRFDGQDCTMVWHFDITERKRAADALKESEERLRGIIENSPATIVLKDMQGRYLIVNKRFQEWVNAGDRDCIGKTAHDFFSKEFADRSVAHEKMAIQAGVPTVRERQTTFPDGITRTTWVHRFPIFGPDGECTAVGTVNIDVTEQRETENQLRQAQKMEAVGQLTGGIAHDFNNFLGVVIGNLDFLVGGLQDNADLLALAEAATKAALSGAALNRQLLVFSRKQNLSHKVIDLNEHLLDMFDMLRRTLGETIDIEAKHSEGPWTANVDPGQLQSAVLNLAVNARDAMPDGGTLTFETRKVRLDDEYAAARTEVTPGEYVSLAVRDTGTGMPPDVLAQVFEPFFTTKDVGEGSGLGLSMVFGFTQQSSGHVEIESAVGQGTTVSLYLPYRRPETGTKAKKPVDIPRARGETVLLVEDDPELLKLTNALLDGLGYRVLRAKDGKTAFAALAGADGVDLLLTDVMMPGGMSGPALAAWRAKIGH